MADSLSAAMESADLKGRGGKDKLEPDLGARTGSGAKGPEALGVPALEPEPEPEGDGLSPSWT